MNDHLRINSHTIGWLATAVTFGILLNFIWVLVAHAQCFPNDLNCMNLP